MKINKSTQPSQSHEIRESRRTILKSMGALFAAGILPSTSSVFAQEVMNRTQDQILGPFYPIMSEPNRSGDLTRVPGGSGRVIDITGKPVEGADIEIWQANSVGRYAHPDDTNPAPLDPNFEGYGALTSGTDGSYEFLTIKPPPYPISPTMTRPAHIHFDVRGRRDELITQMYFEGDPYLKKDPFLQSVPDPDALIVKLDITHDETEPLAAIFDLVIRG